MQYLGGKSRLAKQIAEIIAPKGLWWEPFCGGLSVSVQLAKFGPGLVSDVNPALIALYQAVREGWQPPTEVSKEQYEAARSLPDSDPMKAFCGFGCSFGALWFSGYAGKRVVISKTHPNGMNQDPAGATRKAITRDVAALRHCQLECLSFFGIAPVESELECIYADPPYANTKEYVATTPMDHEAFWQRCRDWARCGARVFVSEFSCPILHRVVWQREYEKRLGSGGGQLNSAKTEKLFEVLP